MRFSGHNLLQMLLSFNIMDFFPVASELVSKDELPSLEECVRGRIAPEAEALGLQHSPV